MATTTKTQTKSKRSTRVGRTARASRARTARRASPAGRSRPRTTTRARANIQPDLAQVEELVLQALETELGGVQVYETAIQCAVNEGLKEEWQEYLDQTRNHVEVVKGLCQELGIEPERGTPGRLVVRHLGESLVQAMQQARSGEPEAAELVAAECVVLAETKDHQNWSLLRTLADTFPTGDHKRAIKEACDEVEDEEDEHLYHTMGWARELWIQSLGLPAVLPPPEEEQDVKSMAGAARAKAGRKSQLRKA